MLLVDTWRLFEEQLRAAELHSQQAAVSEVKCLPRYSDNGEVG